MRHESCFYSLWMFTIAVTASASALFSLPSGVINKLGTGLKHNQSRYSSITPLQQCEQHFVTSSTTTKHAELDSR